MGFPDTYFLMPHRGSSVSLDQKVEYGISWSVTTTRLFSCPARRELWLAAVFLPVEARGQHHLRLCLHNPNALFRAHLPKMLASLDNKVQA